MFPQTIFVLVVPLNIPTSDQFHSIWFSAICNKNEHLLVCPFISIWLAHLSAIIGRWLLY